MYRIAVLLTAAVLAFSACASDDDSTDAGSTSTGSDTTSESSSDTLTVDDVWTRTTPEGAERTAVYVTIATTEADELTGVSVSADVAASAELHETVTDAGDEGMEGNGGMDNGHAGDGVMSMRAVDVIPVPAGTTMLEPGGYHIMLMGLAAPLTAGDSLELTLDFENAGTRTVDVEVREA
ncbi:MAG: copper chaperone PCu(A)C [Acidimicrobiia bacterium]|nr:copper chaperone PCu(A)C [Acidimicrobiia bacterium]